MPSDVVAAAHKKSLPDSMDTEFELAASLPHGETTTGDSSLPILLESASIDQDSLNLMLNAYRLYGVGSAEFLRQLQRSADDIPEIPAATGNGPAKWYAIPINEAVSRIHQNKQGIALFKFRSPLDQPADLAWAFAAPATLGEWQILPMKGEMTGFESFKFDRNIHVPEIPLPPGSLFVFQQLMGGRILPGQEYIIWKIAPDHSDKQMYASLKLVPAGTHESGKSAAEICKALGISAKLHEYPPTELGVRKAFEAAHRIVHFQPSDGNGLKTVLRSVWDQLPEVKIATDADQLVWNHVSPQLSFRFHAGRFKSPMSVPADMNWSCVVENEKVRWGFVARDGDIEEADSNGIEMKSPLSGMTNPENNLAMLQSLSDRQIRPDVEYAIWFAPRADALPDFDFAVRPSPSNVDLAVKSNTQTSGSTVSNQTLHSKLSDLKKLDALYLTHLTHGGGSSLFQKSLQELVDEIPELPVSTGNNPAQWHKTEVIPLSRTLNHGNHLISLFKFRSPLTEPADLHWAFAVPGDIGKWYIVPAKGEMTGFKSFETERNIQMSEVPLPPGSLFVFQELKGGRILPGEEYIIWHIPPDGSDKQMYASLKLTPAGAHPQGKTAAEIRQTLGFKTSPHEFRLKDEKVRKAFEIANRMAGSKPQDQDGLKQVLRSVWDQLPEIQVSKHSGPPLWNQVCPDTSLRFHAVRFKSTLNQMANLNWCYVVNKGQLRWGFVAREGDVEENNTYGMEINCPIPGITHLKTNLAIFQTVEDCQIRPGVEYAIWFVPEEGELPVIDLAIELSPDEKATFQSRRKGEMRRRRQTDIQPIARALGLDIPDVPSSDRVTAALEACKRMIVEGKEKSWQFNCLLESAAPALPVLESDGHRARWNRIDLNKDGIGLAAYRIDIGQISGGRLILAVARPKSVVSQYNLPIRISFDNSRDASVPKPPILTWGTINESWPGIFNPSRFSQDEVESMGLAIPQDSAIDVDIYSGLRFPTKNPCVVVFCPPDASPITLHAAVKVEEETTAIAPTNVASAIDYIGFRIPNTENQGTILGQYQDPISIVKFSDNGESIVSASMSGQVKQWDVAKAKEIDRDIGGGAAYVKAFSTDRTRLAAIFYPDDPRKPDGKIGIYECQHLKQIALFKIPDERIPQTLSFSPDASSLLGSFGGNDNDGSDGIVRKSVIYVWDLKQKGSPQKLEYAKDQPIRSAIWLPDGRIVTAGSRATSKLGLFSSALSGMRSGFKIPLESSEVALLDGKTLKTLERIKEEGPDWVGLAVSGDGTRFGAIARTGWVTVWETKTLQPVCSVPTGNVGMSLSLSKDGHRMVATGFDAEVQVWDFDLMRTLSCGVGKMPSAYHAAISPDGKKIVVAGKDGKVRLYSVTHPEPNDGQGTESLVITNSIGMKLNWIPSGSFKMGLEKSPIPGADENPRYIAQRPRHLVHITKPFYMGRCEVTVAQFRQFVQETGYRTTAETSGRGGSHFSKSPNNSFEDPKLNWKEPGFPQQDNHPVVQVSYNDSVAYCEWLSKKEQVKYRLPTEAEWEYACRAGTTTAFYHGTGNWIFRCSNTPDQELIKAQGSYESAYGNSDGNAYTAPVGSYVPNGFALFDMHGNVWEWCSDWYDANYYANSPANDPVGPNEGTMRVQRGGSCMAGPSDSAWRDFGPPEQVQSSLGFRVVLSVDGERDSAAEKNTRPSSPDSTAAAKQGDISAVGQTVQSKFSDPIKLDALYLTKLFEGGTAPSFQKMLQGLCGEISEIPVASGNDLAQWHKVEVTPLSRNFDTGNHLISLFKFRSPLTKPADLHWAFAVPGDIGEWYIAPAKGEMTGFQSFNFERDIQVPEVPLPPGSLFVFQELKGGRILPGEEYIIWHVPPDGSEKQLYASLKLTPAGTHPQGKTAAEIAQTLGVKSSPLEFPPTQDGVRKAYAAALRMGQFNPQDRQGLKKALKSIWDQMPEIQISKQSGPPIWNQVRTDETSRFYVGRFKSTLDRLADLNLCYVVESEQLRWGFVARDGEIKEADSYAIELNYPISGVTYPENNMAVFQSLPGGQIRPEVEYAIWFAPREEGLLDFNFGVGLSPSNGDPVVKSETPLQARRDKETQKRLQADVQPISRALGMEVPAVPSPERVAAALERCRRMIIGRREKSWQFNRLLEFATPGLPLLESDGDRARWNRIDLNKDGIGMAAFRIDIGQNKGGRLSGDRMLLAVARPKSVITQFNLPVRIPLDKTLEPVVPQPPILTWGIINAAYPGIYAMRLFTQDDVASLGFGIPPESAIDIDYYSDATFPTNNPCVVLFCPPDASPMTLYAAVKIENATHFRPANAASAIESMGFRVPDNENQGTILGHHQTPISIIEFSDNGESIVSASTPSIKSTKGEIKWWNVSQSKETRHEEIDFPNNVKAISPDRTRIATVEIFGTTIKVYETKPLKLQVQLKLPDERMPQTLSFSPDASSLLGCFGGNDNEGNDGVVRKSVIYVWDLNKKGPPQKLEYAKERPIRTACWLPDGRIVTAGSVSPLGQGRNFPTPVGIQPDVKNPLESSEVTLLDSKNLKVLDSLKEVGPDWVSLAVSGDGARFGAIARSGWVTVWDSKTLQPVCSVPTGSVQRGLSLSKDGHRMVATANDGEIQIWDLDLMRTLNCAEGKLPSGTRGVISPDGKRVAVASKEGKVQLYSVIEPGTNNGKGRDGLVVTDSIGLKLNWIPAGSFKMGLDKSIVARGNPDSRILAQTPQHVVQITKPFYMGRYEVTVAQFRQFIMETDYRTTAEKSGKGGSHFSKGSGTAFEDPNLNWKNPGFPQKDDHPVVQVSYHDAVAFCDWLSKREHVKYRLPTEAEWEYACRAGTSSTYQHGSGILAFLCSNVPDLELTKAQGGYEGAYLNSDGNAYTAAVGSYVPNGFALFDMHGNACEWCSDWYDANYYANSPANDPVGPNEGTMRVQRGGSCMVGPSDSAWRDFGPPDQAQSPLGFRVVREIP